jgi:probable F420-dependent oxidoreductase
MQFAVSVHQHHPFDNQFLTSEFVTDFARAAESAGFGALFWTEHPIPSDDWLASGGHDAPDPFVALAFAAAVTTKLKLLTNLTVVPYRNPFLLAKTVATLDRMSNGRVILGVGTGYLKPEYFAMGVDFEERNDLFDESIEVMRKTWTGESVTYTGRHFDAREVRALPRPAQDTVPIWIGGNSKLTRRRVAEKAQGWMPMPNPADVARTTRSPVVETLDDLRPMLAYLRDHAEAVGRRDPIDIMFMCSDGGHPESPDFNAQQHLEALQAQSELGINWSAVNGAEASGEAAFDALHRYADEVISKQ